MRRLPAVAAAVAAILMISACGSQSSPSQDPAGATETSSGNDEAPASTDKLRVGMAVSLSGATADTGAKQLAGVEHWINEGGTLLGREIELVVQDDESNPATAARLYERMISVEEVDLILGPYGSGPSAAVAPVADRHGRFVIMPGASAAEIFTGSEMPVQLLTPQRHLPALPLRLAQEQGFKTMAVAGVNNPYGTETVEGAVNYAEEFGLEVVLTEHYEEDA